MTRNGKTAMGLLDTPPGSDSDMKAYSIILKVFGSTYFALQFLAYWIKFDVAWYDAGQPWDLT